MTTTAVEWANDRRDGAAPTLTVRPAVLDDLPRLHAIAGRAVHTLLRGVWTTEQLAAAADTRIYEVEPALIEAGTYYVAEVDGVVVAGSGWSAGGGFHPGHGSGLVPVAAGAEVAAMRATYVEPRWARRGLATLLARTTETAAVVAGFRRFEALCTPASEAVRRRLGYRLVERVSGRLAGDITVTGAHMRKDLPAGVRSVHDTDPGPA